MILLFSGSKLREERRRQRLTQEELAYRAGSSDRYVRALETGERTNPSVFVVSKLSSALDIPMNDLMTEAEKRAEEEEWEI